MSGGKLPGNSAKTAGLPVQLRDPGECWVCGSKSTRHWRKGLNAAQLHSDDLRITDSRYGTTLSLHRCDACGFRFAPAAEADQLADLYEGLIDPGYEGSQDGRLRQMRKLCELAREAHPAAETALDVGAASGLLVAEAQRAGLDAMGIEPSRSLVELARTQNGVEVLCGVLPKAELEGRQFDVVFLVDVIEHVADPIALLQHCVDRLAEEGLLVLATPDMSSLSAKLLGSCCWHYRLAHVGYFDRRSLEAALARVGLRAFGWHRPVWYFPASYLASRVESYLPVAGFNRLARRLPPLRWIYEREVRLRIPDSYVVLARRSGG
jgi:SAM-dependent methyltransferase